MTPYPIDPRPITLRLEAMTYGGDALGRIDGRTIFVMGGIAGETVTAEIVEQHRQFARARVIEVIEPSPGRVAPRCPHFGFDAAACGGCQWQHIAYAAQLRFKTHIVREQLQRIGRIPDPPVRDTLPSPDVWAYRNHAQFGVTPDGQMGFQAARSHRVIPIDVCHIIQPSILEWLRANRQTPTLAPQRSARPDLRQGRRGRAGRDASAGASTSQRVSALASQRISVRAANLQSPTSDFHIKGVTFRVSAGSFFQVNTSLIGTLIDRVMMQLNPQPNEAILDAYCGVGLFTRFIAPCADRVIGIESSASAIADARVNLAAFEQVDLREGLVEAILPAIYGRIDAAVADPPRAGCGPRVISALIEQKIDRFVYVSCDPSTLARDIRIMLDHGYQLIEVQPIDLFPHTSHIESVALLLRVNRAILEGGDSVC